MKQLILLIFIFLISLSGNAQNIFSLSGQVFDSEKAPMLYGDVILLSSIDSVPKYISHIENGVFSWDSIPTGQYIININCLSYQKIFEPIDLQSNLSLKFTLSENENNLSEATVTAKRNTIVNENGNLKISISNSIYETQPSTMDMLGQLPTLLLSTDRESISVIGKGAPLIYLGQIRISIAELNGIPIESINTVEIINNPSAKYEADGRAVILITRKVGFTDGYDVSLSETANFRRRYHNNANLNFNIKKGKLELRSNFAYNYIQIWEGHNSTLDIPQQSINIRNAARSVGSRPQFVLGGGLYYQINKGDYISIRAYNRSFEDDGSIETYSVVLDNLQADSIATFSDDLSKRGFFSSNINYNKSLKTGNLFLGGQFSRYGRDLKNAISNNYNDSSFELVQNRDQDFSIDAYSLRFDYDRPLLENIKLELGANYYHADALAYAYFKIAATGEETTTNYDYIEKNIAAYGQLSGKIKKVNFTAGLRSETIDITGGFRSADSLLIDRNKTVLFPRANFTFPIDSTKSITLNYAKSITRPNYLNTSSITTYISPYVEYTRNVNLRSSISQEVSLSFQYKRQSINFRYQHTVDPVSTSSRYDEEDQLIRQNPENFQESNAARIQLVSPVQYKKWNATNVVMLTFEKTVDDRAIKLGTKPYLYFYTNNNFRLSSSMNIGFSYYYIGERQTGIFNTKSNSSFSASFSKTFFKKLVFQINVNDLFRGTNYRTSYDINGVKSNATYFSDAQSVSLTLRYSFGKQFKSKYKNKEVDEQVGRMR